MGPDRAWGPEGPRASHRACSRLARTPRSPSLRPDPRSHRPPTLSAQRRLARPAPGGEGKLGRVPPSPPRGPQSPRKAASNRRPRAPGRPIPPNCLRGPRRALPARPAARLRAPEPGEGGAPRDTTGRGTSATGSCCAGSELAELRAPRPCRRQTGPGVSAPLPCLQIWSLVSLGGEGSSGQQAEGIEGQDLGWP